MLIIVPLPVYFKILQEEYLHLLQNRDITDDSEEDKVKKLKVTFVQCLLLKNISIVQKLFILQKNRFHPVPRQQSLPGGYHH